MQIHCLHKDIYRLSKLANQDTVLNKLRKTYQKQIDDWEMLHRHKVSTADKQRIVGISRATYYRHKSFLRCPIIKSKRPRNLRKSKFSPEISMLIKRIRSENPTYGKAKICVILKRDFGCDISESSVGRIMKKLRLSRSMSAPPLKKRRRFNKHAQRFKFKKYNEMEVGENIQIDHMTVAVNGIVFKHFGAWERYSKHLYANVYCDAKSSTAARFLRELIANVPYKIKSIQVDGGSEFMKDFEETCKEFNIPLVVLPPARPKYNGGIERSNRMFREEFYEYFQGDTVTEGRKRLRDFLKKYNEYRPHSALHGLTPLQYISKRYPEAGLSHFCLNLYNISMSKNNTHALERI